MMDAVVVYESIYGDTREVAEAVAEGLGGVRVVPVSVARAEARDAELLIVGGPTHIHGLATEHSRRTGIEAAKKHPEFHVEPEAGEPPGLRAWLADLPATEGRFAAAFDTRLDKSVWMTGSASRGIAKRLREHGYEVIGTDSFLVEAAEGPLQVGELDRARAWGAWLARSVRTFAEAR